MHVGVLVPLLYTLLIEIYLSKHYFPPFIYLKKSWKFTNDKERRFVRIYTAKEGGEIKCRFTLKTREKPQELEIISNIHEKRRESEIHKMPLHQKPYINYHLSQKHSWVITHTCFFPYTMNLGRRWEGRGPGGNEAALVHRGFVASEGRKVPYHFRNPSSSDCRERRKRRPRIISFGGGGRRIERAREDEESKVIVLNTEIALDRWSR